ncbi:IS630 family transposase ISMae29 [subsurface metagenome]
MPKKTYIVELTSEERNQLKRLINIGRTAAYKQRHARILLLADKGSKRPAMKDDNIAKAVSCGRVTVERVRKRFVEEGLQEALARHKSRRQYQRKLDGKGEAHLIALACGEPPEGQKRWTLRLLADRMVALEYVDCLSYQTVRRTLKKTNLSLG